MPTVSAPAPNSQKPRLNASIRPSVDRPTHRMAHHAAHGAGLALGGQPRAAELVQVAQHVVDGAAGADVFGAGQVLFDEAKEIGADLARGLPMRGGDPVQAGQQEQRQAGVDRQCQADAPIHKGQRDEHAHQQQQAAKDADDQRWRRRWPAGPRRRRCARSSRPGVWSLWKAISRRSTCRARSARSVVGGRPAHVFAHIGGADRQRLVGDGDGQEKERGVDQAPAASRRPARCR